MSQELGVSSSKQQVVVMIDNDLMDLVDAWGGDRSQVIEEALYLWCQQRAEPSHQSSAESMPPQPMSPAEYHRQRHDSDETGWLV